MENSTLGQDRVRVNFNTAGTELVDQIKTKSAELIDILEQLKKEKSNNGASVISSEFARLCALAQTDYENAAMWAVKAATF